MFVRYPMHNRGAYSSHIRLAATGAEVIDLTTPYGIGLLTENIDGSEAFGDDPTNPVIAEITFTPRDGATFLLSTQARIVDPNIGGVDAIDDNIESLDDGLDAYGQPISTSFTIKPPTRTNLQKWAWKSTDGAVVDINISWTDVSVL